MSSHNVANIATPKLSPWDDALYRDSLGSKGARAGSTSKDESLAPFEKSPWHEYARVCHLDVQLTTKRYIEISVM